MPKGKRAKKEKAAKAKALVAATVETPAPAESKPKAPAPARKKRISKAEVKAILDKVAALKAGGASLTKALKDLNLSQANYYYWMKTQGTGVAAAAGKAEANAGANSPAAAQNGKTEKMRAVLDVIEALRTSGLSLDKAIKQKGLTVSNYYYWQRRLRTKGLTAIRKGGSTAKVTAVGKTGDVTGLLDAMKRNRVEAARLEAEWQEMVRRLKR